MTDALSILQFGQAHAGDDLTWDSIQHGVPLAPEDQFCVIRGPSMPSLEHTSVYGKELADTSRFIRALQSIFPHRTFRHGWEDRAGVIIQWAMGSKLQTQTPITLDAGQSGLMLQSLRPYVVFANGATVVNDWVVTGAAAGWTAAEWTVNLNHSTGPVTQNQFTALLLGIGDFAQSPKVQESQVVDPATLKYGVQSFPTLGMNSDTQLHLWSDSYYLGLNESSWTVDVNFGVGGNSIPVLVGCQAARKVGAVAETV